MTSATHKECGAASVNVTALEERVGNSLQRASAPNNDGMFAFANSKMHGVDRGSKGGSR